MALCLTIHEIAFLKRLILPHMVMRNVATPEDLALMAKGLIPDNPEVLRQGEIFYDPAHTNTLIKRLLELQLMDFNLFNHRTIYHITQAGINVITNQTRVVVDSAN